MRNVSRSQKLSCSHDKEKEEVLQPKALTLPNMTYVIESVPETDGWKGKNALLIDGSEDILETLVLVGGGKGQKVCEHPLR